MINLTSSGNSVTFSFSGQSGYLNNGEIVVPKNSLSLVLDTSDMAVFKKSNSDVFIAALVSDFGMTKDELEAWYKENMVGSTGGGGIESGDVQTMIDDAVSGKADSATVEAMIVAIESGMSEDERVTAAALNDLEEKKLDASAYTPTDLSNYDTKSEVNTKISTATGSINTALANHTGNTNIHVTSNDKNNWNSKVSQGDFYQLVDEINVKEEVIASAITKLSDTKLDASAYTPTDLSNYYTSAQTESAITAAVSGKQDTLIAGDNITISGNVISASGGVNVVQTTGTSTTDVMSQDAVTTELNDKVDEEIVTYSAITYNVVTIPLENGYKYEYTLFDSSYAEYIQIKASNINGFELDYIQVTEIENDSQYSGTVDVSVDGLKYTITAKDGCKLLDIQTVYGNYLNNYITNISVAEKYNVLTVLNNKVDTSAIVTAVTSASTDSEIPSAKAVFDAIPTGGGASYQAGRGIDITNDTISFNLPISAGTGQNSVVFGTDYGSDAFLSAYTPYVSSTNSFAFGSASVTTSENSFATGYLVKVIGGTGTYGNFAQGYMTTASGNRCHSEGLGTSATSDASHSEGYNTTASGNYSHSEGEEVKATNVAEHSQGRYNVSNKSNTTFGDSGNTLFSVGNGTSNSARHNAFEIRQNGDIYCSDGTNDVKLQDYIQFKIAKLTQAEYDALVQGGTVDANTVYFITNSNS